MNKYLKRSLWFILFLIIVFLIAFPKIRQGSPDEIAGPARGGQMRVSVNGFLVSPRTLASSIQAVGTVLANQEVELRAEVSGRVVKLHFQEGAKVSKGQLLVKLDDSELQAELKRASHRKKLAEDIERRQRALLEKEGVSREEYDRALNELNVQEAEIELLKARIAKTEIRAPFNGIIGLQSIHEGSYLTPASLIASVQDISRIKIEFSIPERYFAQVSAGTNISFTIQGLRDELQAAVYAIDPKVDPDARTIQLRAITGNPGEKIFPGAFADIRLVLENIFNAVMVPTEAVVPDLRGHKVFVYRSGEAKMQPVELGIRREKEVQVLSGLSGGDTVITTGILQMRPGLPVSIKEIRP